MYLNAGFVMYVIGSACIEKGIAEKGPSYKDIANLPYSPREEQHLA